MATNPFTILATPQDAANVLQSGSLQDEPIYTQLAREAGRTVRTGFANAGMPFTADDARAVRTKSIMETSQKKYAEYVKDGKMTVDEAQAAVLEDAIKGFSQAGDWEQALSLTQPLNALKAQQLERQKLKADVANAEAKPDQKELDQQIKMMQIQSTYDAKMAALELAEQKANTAAERAAIQNQLDQLRMEQLLQKIQAGTDGKPEKEPVAKFKARQAINSGIQSAAETASLMADLRELIVKNPAAATSAGPIASKVAGALQGARAFVQANGYDPNLTKEGIDSDRWVKMNVADQAQQSLVITLAYSFARANDPGGRLSNQDLEMAKQVVSGGGSPQARLAVLDQAFAKLARKTTRDFGAAEDLELKVGDNARKGWQEAATRYGNLIPKEQAPATKAAPGGAAPANETAAQRAERLLRGG